MEEIKRTIILTLTQNCNLSCTYCFEHNKSLKTMDYETAIQIIKDEYDSINQDEMLEVDFFGGEPFLEFELIKAIVTYTENNGMSDRILFFVDTNGTLLDDSKKDWLVEHRDDFVCGLSYDGNEWMQDVNRCGSSKLIDLEFFNEYYPFQTVKMTVSTETLPKLSDGIIYLEQKGFEVACNLAYGIDWENEENSVYLQRELSKLIDYYLENPNIVPCSLLNKDITGVTLNKGVKRRFCGAKHNVVAYDVDGREYPCQLFMPLSVGKEKADKSQNLTFFEDIVPDEMLDEKCKKCVIKSICPTCYGSNYLQYDDIYMQDENYCRLQKIIMKAQAYFWGLKWKLKKLDMSKEEEHILLDSILAIQKNL